jgi:hypothetical protein
MDKVQKLNNPKNFLSFASIFCVVFQMKSGFYAKKIFAVNKKQNVLWCAVRILQLVQ